ncbi:hypothetical protein K2D_17950 [Planctomycetes bacterium K2D]|nr:hypothetical protein K2D_17950 [Planctomycetes bacterium K2D]
MEELAELSDDADTSTLVVPIVPLSRLSAVTLPATNTAVPEAPAPAAPATLSASELAAREWPALRASILDIAATLDRLDRLDAAAGPTEGPSEARTQAETLLRLLLDNNDGNRARRVLERLSRPYDPNWRDAFAISADS